MSIQQEEHELDDMQHRLDADLQHRLAVRKAERRMLHRSLQINAINSLFLPCISDCYHHGCVSQDLLQNKSVTKLVFMSDSSRDEFNESAMVEGDWLRLLAAFRLQRAAGIKHLVFMGHDIPFIIIPTMIWQFRNLTHLVLRQVDGFQWTDEHWQTFAASLYFHKTLVVFELFISQYNVLDTTNDTLIAALNSIPSLKVSRIQLYNSEPMMIIANDNNNNNNSDVSHVDGRSVRPRHVDV